MSRRIWTVAALVACCLATEQARAVEKASEQVSSFYGSFSHAIPIEVPRFRGLEPQIALSYSSEGRNGFVGVGWNVTGFSTIQRVNEGLGTPRFDINDLYLLDGQELYPCKPGSVSPSCTTGGTHSTKIESYLRIKFESGPNTWTVWSKNGTKTVLSPTITVPANATVPGGTLRWGVSSRVDTDLNTVSYAWSCQDGDCYPSTASYNGYQVAFFKEARPDWLSWAGGTVLGETRYRLRSVIVWAPSLPAHIRGYKLGYSTSPLTGRSLLTSVQQYGKDLVHSSGLLTGGTTLPAQTFTYQNDQGTAFGKNFSDWGLPLTLPTYSTPVTWANYVNAAITGDGSSLLKTGGSASAWDAGADSTYAISAGNGYVEWKSSQPVTDGKAAGLSFGNTDATLNDIDFAFYEGDNNSLSAVQNGVIKGTWTRATGDTLRVEVTSGVVYFKKNGSVLYQSTAVPIYPLRVDASLRGTGASLDSVVVSGSLIGVNAWCQALLYSGDFNGDGRTDQLCYSTVGSSPTSKVSLASDGGLQAPTTWLTGAVTDPVFADFNNDGKTDVAKHDPSSGQFHVALSTGTAFGSWALWGDATGTAPGGGAAHCRISAVSVGSGDFNGDGVTDVYCHQYGTNLQFVGLSTGSAFTFSVFSQYSCDTAGDEQLGVIDFDGDGKDDWYCIGASNHNMYVFPSTGSAFLWPAHGSLGFCSGDQYVLGDFNGDGRTDATCMGDGSVALSNGRGFQIVGSYGGWCGGGQAFAADVDGDGASEIVCNNPGAGASDIQVRKWKGAGQTPALAAAETWKASWCGGLMTAGDWNGDGKTDLYCKSTVAPAVAGTSGFVADMLSTTNNGTLGTAQIAYVSSTIFVHTNNPPVKPVVASIVSGDGVGSPTTTAFIYSGGLMDRKERMFLGFRYAKTTLPCLSGETACPYQESWFYQDLASSGLLEKSISRHGGGNILAMRTFGYTTNGTALPRTSLLTSESTYSYDGTGCPSSPCGQEKLVTTTHTYGAYGNKTGTSWGGDPSTGKDNRSATWEYTPNATAYIVGLVGREQKFDNSGSLMASTRYSYDLTGATGSWTTPPTKGHQTHKEEWLDQGNRWVTTKVEYDTYGNPTKETDPTLVTVTTTYDTARHIFPETSTNLALPTESVTAVWDPVCGLPTQKTDANAQVESYQSDALCRRTRTDTPLSGFEIRSFRDFGVPGLQRVVVETPSAVSGGANKFVASHFDGTGRTVRTVSSGATAAVPIVADTVYNERGQVASRTAPYYTGDAIYTTTFDYDALGRVTLVAHPDSNTIAKSYGLWAETTTDENAHPTTVRFDAYGQVTNKEELLSGSTLTTHLSYDALGRRTSMADALGNVWTWQFDSLGRNYQETDPDSGTKTSTFDDANRVKTMTNAKNERIEQDYDTAGRKSVKRTYNAANVLTGTSTMLYGEARSGFFNKGHWTTISGPGTTSITADYDARGRMARNQRTIDGVTYTLSKTFDAGSRLLTLTHPDGSVGPYAYDLAGRVTSLPGIINSVTYDASGQPLVRSNANGTNTTRTYSPERGLLTGIIAAGSYNLQDLSYANDPTGRVESVTSGHVDESWTYGYDDLYRLTSATSANAPLTQTWTYDEVNRITSNSKIGSYTYPASGAPRPHAPVTAGPKSYSYDSAGQTSIGDGRTFTWNVDSLPTQVNTTAYVYDGMGQRIKHTLGAVTTLYPFGDDYEIAGAVTTKYIDVKGLGLVAKRTAGQTFWLHTDRLGSIQVVSNSAGNEVLRRTYRPSGEKYQDSTAHVESRGWMGQRTDANGLTFLHARYLDAPLGCFASPDNYDPWNPGVGLNRYIYGLGDAINNADPSGHINCIAKTASVAVKHGGILTFEGTEIICFGVGWTQSGGRSDVGGYGTGNGGGTSNDPHGGYGGDGGDGSGLDPVKPAPTPTDPTAPVESNPPQYNVVFQANDTDALIGTLVAIVVWAPTAAASPAAGPWGVAGVAAGGAVTAYWVARISAYANDRYTFELAPPDRGTPEITIDWSHAGG